MRHLLLLAILVSGSAVPIAAQMERTEQIHTYQVTRSDVYAGSIYASIIDTVSQAKLKQRIHDCACSALGTKPATYRYKPNPGSVPDHLVSAAAPGYLFVHRTRMTCDGSEWNDDLYHSPSGWAAISTGDSVECFRVFNNISRFLIADLSLNDSMLSRRLLQCLGVATRFEQVPRIDPLFKRQRGGGTSSPCVLFNRNDLGRAFIGWFGTDITVHCACYHDTTLSKYASLIAGDLEIAAPTLERFNDSALLILNLSVVQLGLHRPFYGLVQCSIMASRDGIVEFRRKKLHSWSSKELLAIYR